MMASADFMAAPFAGLGCVRTAIVYWMRAATISPIQRLHGVTPARVRRGSPAGSWAGGLFFTVAHPGRKRVEGVNPCVRHGSHRPFFVQL